MKRKSFTAFLIASTFLFAPLTEIVSAGATAIENKMTHPNALQIPMTGETAHADHAGHTCPHHGKNCTAHSKGDCKASHSAKASVCSISKHPPGGGEKGTLISSGQEFIPAFEAMQQVMETAVNIKPVPAKIGERNDRPELRPPTA